MIRVAVCDQTPTERIRVRNAVERYARSTGINNIEAMLFANPPAFEKAVTTMRSGFFDLCFCRIDAAQDGPAMREILRNLSADSPDTRLVLVSAEKSDAIHAYDLNAEFLLVAGTYDDFVRAVSGALSNIVAKNNGVAVVKSRGSVEKVMLADIQFVESSKRGSIIHLPLGKTVTSRSPLQALFENLAESERNTEKADEKADEPGRRRKRFVKAGSSFIVNLDNVRSAGEGSFIFADGETIIVPVRKRKALLDALRTYQTR